MVETLPEPRHLITPIELDGIVCRRACEPFGPFGIVTKGSGIAQQVDPIVP